MSFPDAKSLLLKPKAQIEDSRAAEAVQGGFELRPACKNAYGVQLGIVQALAIRNCHLALASIATPNRVGIVEQQ